jgi:hypothetical protein
VHRELPFVTLYEIELADQSPLYLSSKAMEEFAASLSDTCVRRRQGTRKHEGLRLILVLQQRGKRCEMWSFYATSQSDKNLAISVLSQFEFALPPRSRSRTWRSIIQPISRINLVACPEILRQQFLCPKFG